MPMTYEIAIGTPIDLGNLRERSTDVERRAAEVWKGLRLHVFAEDFLKYTTSVLQVEFVRDDPNPDLAAFQRNVAANNKPGFTGKGDLAVATVRYRVNKIEIEDHLRVTVSSAAYSRAGSCRVENCSAYVKREFAPKGKYLSETFASINHSLTVDPQWNQAWTAAKEGTQRSMQNTANSMNARSRATDDWCDYSLDQQKRLDPNTGLITKDSSAYNYTWVNEQGERVQTNNINANPNGNRTGNWTLQENIPKL